jgi:hypothetical protein
MVTIVIFAIPRSSSGLSIMPIFSSNGCLWRIRAARLYRWSPITGDPNERSEGQCQARARVGRCREGRQYDDLIQQIGTTRRQEGAPQTRVSLPPPERQSPASVEFDFEKPASIAPGADELRLHRLDEITQPRGSGWRDFNGSVVQSPWDFLNRRFVPSILFDSTYLPGSTLAYH